VELDPFEYTKLMHAYRKWKDNDYEAARNKAIMKWPGESKPPCNFNGPFTLLPEDELQEIARRRQNHLAQIHARLLSANQAARRPLLERLCFITGEGVTRGDDSSHELWDNVALDPEDLEILAEFFEPSWNLDLEEYGKTIKGVSIADQGALMFREKLEEFEEDVKRFFDSPEFPLWQPDVDTSIISDTDSFESYFQPIYNRRQLSTVGISLEDLIQSKINTDRQRRAGPEAIHLWTNDEATIYLSAMHHAGRIQ
jgi:hypothetical protein